MSFSTHGGKPPPGRGDFILWRYSVGETLDLGTHGNRREKWEGFGLKNTRLSESPCAEQTNHCSFLTQLCKHWVPVTLSSKDGVGGHSSAQSVCLQRKVLQITMLYAFPPILSPQVKLINTSARRRSSIPSHQF